MSPRLVKSALFATGLHGLLMLPLGVSFHGRGSAQTGVLRGTSSVELELVGPAEPERVVAPPLAPAAEPGASRPPAEEQGEEVEGKPLPPTGGEFTVWEPGQGALGPMDPAGMWNLPPRYPRLARVNGWQGTVLLRVSVSSAGAVEAVEVRRSSGFPVLDEAALLAVRQWRFRPAVRAGASGGASASASHRGGAPSASLVEFPVTFRLEK